MTGGPVTYILPDIGHACLLGPILKDAPTGAVIEVHSLTMFELVIERISEAGREDIAVHLADDAPARASVV